MHKLDLYHKWIPYNGKMDNPVVLLHGFLETHTIWYNLPLNEIKKPILLIDLPGFGKSKMEDDNRPTIWYYAAQVLQLLESYSITKYQVVGHSMGGYVGLELQKKDERLQKLVLLNSNFWSDSPTKMKERTRVADILLKNKDRFIQEAIPNLFIDKEKSKKQIEILLKEAKNGVAEWYAYATIAMRERADFTMYVEQNPSKLAIIHGDLDTLISTSTLLEKKPTSIPLEIEKNSGHMSLFEQPQNTIQLINQLLY